MMSGPAAAVRAVMFTAALLIPLWAAAAPSEPLTYEDARHLLARTGFGPTDAEVRAVEGLTRTEAVRRLLQGTRTVAVTPLPPDILDFAALQVPRGPEATPEERKAFVQEQVREGVQLRAWWIEEMLVTPSPLTERMTLFWHNHFVSAQPKVRVTSLMAAQNATLRAHALGNFGTLLHAISRDPAMLVYLDNAQNRRGAPNENFAREVMELFTLGEGHYTEQDVKEAARAFTGWTVDRQTGRFAARPALHDNGPKTVFGKTGNFDGDDVVDLLLGRADTADFVVGKLWREFVSPQLDAQQVTRISAAFRDSHYDITVAVGEILRSDAFYAPENRGVLVKSPVDVVVGTLRQLDLHPRDTRPFAIAAAGMGQNLFSAPNVKGWPGGEAWINTSTLLARKAFVERLTRGDDSAPAPMQVQAMPRQVLAAGGLSAADTPRAQQLAAAMQRGVGSLQFDGARWMSANVRGGSAPERNQAAARLLLATAPQQPLDPSSDALTFVRRTLLDAAYQLK